MKPTLAFRNLLWAALLGLSLSAYLYLAQDTPTADEEAVRLEESRPYHIVGDVLFLKQIVEEGRKVLPR